jgi:hypothetical protein
MSHQTELMDDPEMGLAGASLLMGSAHCSSSFTVGPILEMHICKTSFIDDRFSMPF